MLADGARCGIENLAISLDTLTSVGSHSICACTGQQRGLKRIVYFEVSAPRSRGKVAVDALLFEESNMADDFSDGRYGQRTGHRSANNGIYNAAT